MLLATESSFRETFLQNFLSISTWQSLIAVAVFFVVTGGFWYGLKQIKIKFVYRILIGMLIGLIFGVIIQATIGFPGGDWFNFNGDAIWVNNNGDWLNISKYYACDDAGDLVLLGSISDKEELAAYATEISNSPQLILTMSKGKPVPLFSEIPTNFVAEVKSGTLWVVEFNVWAQLIKQIFINGILLITIPVVFIAIFRVIAKPGNNRIAKISGKGVAILLINVAVAFTITFWIGYLLKIGKGLNFDVQVGADSGRTDSVPLPYIVSGYIPSNIVATLSATAIIPVIVLAALFGQASKFVRKKHPESIENLLTFMDRAWDIVMSILMTFMKIMPLAVISMLATAITTRPIGVLASIGIILLVGYLGLIIMLGFMTLVMFLFKINVINWWKYAWKPLIQGFSTQSSNATLPVTIDTIETDMKIKPEVGSIIAPISTSLGLVACAGVQAGLITSVLYTGSSNVATMNVFAFFIIALFTTIIASIGIAGVPGTATVVTSAVLNGIGYGIYFAPVYAIFGAIDGLFDMGRTATNVTGGVFAATLVAKSEKMFDPSTNLISQKRRFKLFLKNMKKPSKRKKQNRQTINKIEGNKKNDKEN